METYSKDFRKKIFKGMIRRYLGGLINEHQEAMKEALAELAQEISLNADGEQAQ